MSLGSCIGWASPATKVPSSASYDMPANTTVSMYTTCVVTRLPSAIACVSENVYHSFGKRQRDESAE